jgi:hypothetical protein
MLAATSTFLTSQHMVRSSHHVTHAGITYAGRRTSACVFLDQSPDQGAA